MVNFQKRFSYGVLLTEIYVDKIWPDNAIEVRQETRQNNGEKTLRQKTHWCHEETLRG